MTEGLDRRELILVRLEAIARGIEDVDWYGRNALLADSSDRRRITVLEGEEITPEVATSNRHAGDKQQVMMIPEILIACGARTRDIGPDLNMMRARLIKQVLTDETLLALTVNGRSIQYGGMNSDLAFAALMEGKMSMKFRITYMLDPKAL
jgi:hypothetical protein